MSWDPILSKAEWEQDQFVDRLEQVLELATDHPEADVEELAGWSWRPLHETGWLTRDDGLEVRTPRGVFLVTVQKVPDHG